ncbi:MAG: SNF2-related protein, partial [Candidatus Thorarchaeota archaeon]
NAEHLRREDLLWLRGVLLKYKSQLESYGVDYQRLKTIQIPDPDAKDLGIKIWVKERKIYVVTPYDRKYVNLVSKIPTRHWNTKLQANTFQYKYKDLVKEAIESSFNVQVEIPPPDISEEELPPEVYLVDVRVETKTTKIVVVQTAYNERLINIIRKMPKRTWTGKRWEITVTSETDINTIDDFIKEFNLRASPEMLEYIQFKRNEFQRMKEKKKELIELSNKASLIYDEELPKAPADMDYYPFQKVGIKFIEKNNGRALIADEMGLGKCCSKDTYIPIFESRLLSYQQGQSIRIEDLFLKFASEEDLNQDEVFVEVSEDLWVPSLKDQEVEPNRILKVYRERFQGRMIRIVTDDNRVVVVTQIHKLPTVDGWKEARELVVGDELRVPTGIMCKECGRYFNSQIPWGHLRKHHNLTIDEYKRIHGGYTQSIERRDAQREFLSSIDDPIVRVKSIDYVEYDDWIYDLMVENNHNYVGNEFFLHNTIQALGYFYIHPEIRPVLIVCPASVKINWFRETLLWCGVKESDIQVIQGKKAKIERGKQFYIINYDVLSAYPIFKLLGFQSMVLDEVHYIKNRDAARTKAALALSQFIPSVIGLTGTPVLNRPIELYNAIQAIGVDDPMLSDLWNFATRYCGAVRSTWGWDFSGATNLDELNVKLRENIMIRRLKRDVLEELPSKRRMRIFMELTNKSSYDLAERDFTRWMIENEESGSADVLAQVEKLKQLVAKGKMKYVLEWIDDYLEETGKKVVIFAHHIPIQEQLFDHYKDVATRIYGGMSPESKQASIDAFNNDPDVKVCIASMKAAQEGVNLQKSCSTAIFVELGWTPGEHNQAEDRVHRIGQDEQV